MGHVSSLCVLCSPCYSRWCYGQILAIAPLQKMYGREWEKTLSTARGRGGVSTWYFHQIQVGMWAKLWNMSHLFVCFVALVIARWRHTSKRPVCRYTGYQHCSNLQAPKHYLIRAANYLLAQNGSKNSNIVNLVLVYDFLRSLYLFRSVLWWGTRSPNAS